MTLRFVATSVLKSEDGIEFSKEEMLETEEAKKARLQAEKGSNKPLYEQLMDQQRKKQEEYDANTKLIFAPPKAMDIEDVAYFEELNKSKSSAMKKRKEIEDDALDAFRLAQRMKTTEKDHHLIEHATLKEKSDENVKDSTFVTVIKRKKIEKDPCSKSVDLNPLPNPLPEATVGKAKLTDSLDSSPLASLGSYGSDSE